MKVPADIGIGKFHRIFISIVAAGFFSFPSGTIAQTVKSFRDCATCPEMVEIPKGTFLMGSDVGRDEEKPMHRVTIENNFAVGKYEVTRNQYAIFIESSNYAQDPGCEVYDLPSFNMDLTKSWIDPAFEQDSDHPVVCVSWHDAQSYVEWLSSFTSKEY